MIEEYLCHLYQCTLEDLHSHSTILTKNKQNDMIKVMAYKNATIVTCSQQYADLLKDLIEDKTRDQIFELPYVYGQTLHYYFEPVITLDYIPKFQYEIVEDVTFLKNFKNAIDENTKLAMIARDGEELIGVAGASQVFDSLYEIGVDVLQNYQNQGIASYLVYQLGCLLKNKKITTLYSASTTNLASQMVAYNSGFRLCWIDTFGTVGDENDVFKKKPESGFYNKLMISKS